MTSVARFELILLLMTAVVLLELVARRLRLPPAAALILGGIALALVPGMPEVDLDSDLVLVLFLPPLLMGSAYFTVWRDFRANLRIILGLAVGAVVFTTLVVGWVMHLMAPALPLAACFALGAIVSPPDAVAAKAVLQRLPLPRRIVVLLEGESLVNDATGLVLFKFAVAAALTGTFSLTDAVLQFGVLAVGGVAVGLAFGFGAVFVFSRLRDAHMVIVGSLLVAWASYIGGEVLHVSGVLATVACGMVLGWKQHATLSAAVRTQAGAVWGVTEFVLESLVFILIGLSLRGVLQRLGGWDGVSVNAAAAAVIIGAVILSRFFWIIPFTYISRLLMPWVRKHDPYPPLGVPVVMSWAGMRGVVSLAVALSLPDGFPGRDFILAVTFATILVTVLVQGTTLAPMIRALNMDRFVQRDATTLSESEAVVRMATAQLAVVQRYSTQPDGSQRHPRLLEQYTFRVGAATRFHEAEGGLSSARTEHFTVLLAAIEAGRAELLRLHRAGEIHDSVLHELEQTLDMEELSARRRLGTEPER